MEDINFEKMFHEIGMENLQNAMNEELEKIKKEQPNAYFFLPIGRLIGRFDIIRQLISIVDDGKDDVDNFLKWWNERKPKNG